MVTYVLGGGVTGLNTAREIAKRGKKVVLIEADNKLGGLAGYIKAFGRNLDLGPHIFHTPDSDIKEYLVDSFPNVFFERQHWAANFKDNRFYDYPISREFINSLPPEMAEKIHDELAGADVEEARTARSYADYIRAIAGPTLTELFFTTYPKKVWGRPTTELDANWAPKRVQIREKREPFFGEQWSAVGMDGTASIINELENQCSKLGVDINLSCPITSLKIDDKNRVCEIVTQQGSFKVNEDDDIVNTLPLDIMASLIGFPADVEYRGVMLAFIHTTNVSPFPEGIDFIYVDDPEVTFNRVSDQNTFVAKPVEDSTVICCEITYSENDENDARCEHELLDEVKTNLATLGILGKHEILGGKLVKLPRVYPMFSLGYRDSMNAALGAIGSITNLITLGSLAEFAYSDLQILFAKSRDLAERICDRTPKINKIGHHKAAISFNSEFKLLDKWVGPNHPCFTIAEIGLNHNGSMEMAVQLVDAAVAAGFDAVKFQSFKSEGRSASAGRTSKYVEKVIGTEETDFEMFQRCELSFDQHKFLFDYCKKQKVSVFSAPFDEESVDLLEELNVDAFKIASMELTNHRLVKYIASKNKPIILSTGMATLAEIEETLEVLNRAGSKDVAVLQCTSIYPAPAETVNLRSISTLEQSFKLPVGYSDHFPTDTMSISAVALGAKIIEKHVTLDRRLEGPDHTLSLPPEEQRSFIKAIKDVEVGLGSGIKRPHRDEAKSEVRFRKSMYLRGDMQAGQVISSEDIIFKAPCFGILPKYEDIIVGMTLRSDTKADQPLTWEMLT